MARGFCGVCSGHVGSVVNFAGHKLCIPSVCWCRPVSAPTFLTGPLVRQPARWWGNDAAAKGRLLAEMMCLAVLLQLAAASWLLFEAP